MMQTLSLGKVTIAEAVERLHYEFTELGNTDLMIDFDIADDQVEQFEAMLKELGASE